MDVAGRGAPLAAAAMEPPSIPSPHEEEEGAVQKALPRADIICHKVILSLSQLEPLQEDMRGNPQYKPNDILDQTLLTKLMLKESQQLVRFENAPQQNSIITKEHRRCSRLKNQCAKYPPLNMWAQWVLESKIFTRAILFLTILNTIVLGIQSEVFDNMDPSLVILKLILNIVDWSIVAIFLLEILLKWIDDFFMFWKNNWNIFDFMVTILSILPEVIKLYQGQNTSGLAFMKLIRMCRILRTLKMFSKFPRYRVLVLAISAGIKDLFFIFLLLLVFAYIFAVTGIVLFQSYTDSDQPDLEYKQSFKDIPNSLTTLFIIFTMDHWYELMLDTWKVAELDKTISSLYIIIWLLISSFIFKNIFMGIMVNKFQAIRQDMFQEMQQIQIRQNIDLFRAENINSDSPDLPVGGTTDSLHKIPEETTGKENISRQSVATEKDWETYMEEYIQVMQEQEENDNVTWPQDSLFKYYEYLQKLQYNLDERNAQMIVGGQAFAEFE